METPKFALILQGIRNEGLLGYLDEPFNSKKELVMINGIITKPQFIRAINKDHALVEIRNNTGSIMEFPVHHINVLRIEDVKVLFYTFSN